jgi:DNA-binding transcriptional LysR family regulator
MEPDLNDLAISAEVIAAKSFSEAARRLHIPTSTISRRIADLESQLGVSLIIRTTRQLRLTEVGSEVLEFARQGAELRESVGNIAASHTDKLSGTLRISAPPSISDSFLAPLVGAFQNSYPDVRIQIFITDRIVDPISEGIDLAFMVRNRHDPSHTVLELLTYRPILVASPSYLAKHNRPKTPRDLRSHRLLAFSFWRPQNVWNFTSVRSKAKERVTFQPYLSINEYSGLASALLAGTGIGELPPIVQPELLRSGKLVEVMPEWQFTLYTLSIVHVGNRFIPKIARIFKEFALEFSPTLFSRFRRKRSPVEAK